MHRAREIFRRAWLLKSFAFRFAVVLGAILFALAYVFTLLALAMSGFAGTGRTGSTAAPYILFSPLPIGIAYHFIMRAVLRKQFLQVRRTNGELICAFCGYSTEGLPPNSPCPECGTPT